MSQFQDASAENVANQSLLFTMLSTTFGNMGFQVLPPDKGEVGAGFPTVPYISLEAQLYQQASSNPIVAPNNIASGGTAGTQNISGTMTATDNTGNIRVAIGNGSF